MAIDHFPTPPDICRAAFDKDFLVLERFDNLTALDAGCGSGVWGHALMGKYPFAEVDGVDVRVIPKPHGFNHFERCNFFEYTHTPSDAGYDVVIGNPPYSTAEDWIRHSWQLLSPEGGWMIFLLRLAFLEGQGRGKGLWRELPPAHVSVLSRRPSFTGNGVSDPRTAYGVFYWQRNRFFGGLRKQMPHTFDWLDWNES